ncbi:hypothetical protein RB600_004173 [Gaeumannomyces tritici]
MAGLIPLRLQPAPSPTGRRSSAMFPSPTSLRTQQHAQPPQQPQHKELPPRPTSPPPPPPPPPCRPSHGRRSSMSSFSPAPVPSAILLSPSPKTSRAMKHVSQPNLSCLPVLPYTPIEWKRTMAEIKRHHGGKRFRACSSRCVEILDNLKDSSTVEPAHLIYLHFYAANSLEMRARPFPIGTLARGQLLTQARKHYDEAAALIMAAEVSVTSRTRSGSACASGLFTMNASCLRSPSLHSPSGSVSSGTWSTPTTNSSPTNSVCSFDDMLSKSSSLAPSPRCSAMASTPRSAKAKKTVSFSLPKEETFKFPTEPVIRPDSPTLGFDDAYFSSPITKQELPELPRGPAVVHIISEPEGGREFARIIGRQNEYEDDQAFFIDPLDEDDYDRSTARSVYRYCETLSVLRAQIASHSHNLDELMGMSCKATEAASPVSPALSCGSLDSASEEMLALDRQARIERLRRQGWQRKRFDASRYERLCNDVLAELS